MDILHSNLEAIEAMGFQRLNFHTEVLKEILVNDAVAGGEESQEGGDEIMFIVSEELPINQILSKIDFLSDPETGHGLFVEFPEFMILDGVENKPVGFRSQEGFGRGKFWFRPVGTRFLLGFGTVGACFNRPWAGTGSRRRRSWVCQHGWRHAGWWRRWRVGR